MIKRFLDFFFNDCICCKNPSEKYNQLCQNCENDLEYILGCYKCPKNELCGCATKNIVLFHYNDVVRKLILMLKYNQKRFLTDFFIEKLFSKYDFSKIITPNTVLVPVPVSRKKLFQREYNQSLLLCQSFQKKIKNVQIAKFALKKTKDVHQKNMDKDQRAKTVHNIYVDQIDDILNKDLIIIDDVIASGNTMERCSTILAPYAKSITCIAIAQT